MAEPLTTIALALKAAAKALVKKLSTKAIKKAVVKGVKKKAKGKIKDKLMGKKKKDKRQIAKNIMQEQGEFPGGGAIVATPTTALIPKEPVKGGALAVIDKGESGGPLDFKKMGEKIDNIVEMTDAIAMLTGVEKKQAKEQADARRIAKAKAEKKAREAKLEAKKGGEKVPGVVKKPAQSLLDMMMKFLMNVALGAIVLSIIKLIANAKKIWEGIKEGFLKFFWIIRSLLIKGFLPRKLLQGVGKSIKVLGGLIKGFVSKTLAPFKKVGSVIFNAFKGAAKGIAGFIGNIATKIGNVINAVKNGAVNMVKNAFPGLVKWTDNVVKTGVKAFRATKETVKAGFQGAKTWLSGTAKTAKVGMTGGLNKLTGGIFKRGIGKAGGRMALKVFGKSGVKAIGGIMGKAKAIFGRIPLVGPLMVAISGMLEDPPQSVGRIAYRAFGTALGGLLGGMIGAVGGPLALVGMILGEMIGEFTGDLFYSLFHGGGISEVKEKFVAKMKQIWEMATGVGKWLGKGFINFTEGLLKKHPIEIKKGWGVRAGLTKAAKTLGLKDWLKKLGYINSEGQVDKFPNLLQLLNPFSMGPLLIDSFFKSEEGTQDTPAEVIPGASDASDVTTEEGIEAKTDDKKEITSANLGPTDSGAGENANAVSSEASYEGHQGGDKTFIAPDGGASGGGSGGSGKPQIMIVGSKDALNNYIKAMNSKSLSAV